MDYILYLLIFCIGTLFGSFFSLAIYRIPLGQDITHTRSYCPKCNHKLSFLDMIPIFSYSFLGGKCRYCKETIRSRYLILEVLSGITFVLFALSFKFSMFDIFVGNMQKIAYLIAGFIYIATLYIIAGIDKENIKVEKSVVLFGFVCVSLYIVYLCVVGIETNIYRYIIYLTLFCLLTVFSIVYLRKKSKSSYTIDILLLLILMLIFTYEGVCIYTVTTTLIAVAVQLLLNKINTKKGKYIKVDKKTISKMPVAFYMATANILILLASNFYIFYR